MDNQPIYGDSEDEYTDAEDEDPNQTSYMNDLGLARMASLPMVHHIATTQGPSANGNYIIVIPPSNEPAIRSPCRVILRPRRNAT